MARDKHEEGRESVTIKRVRDELQAKIDDAMFVVRDLADLNPMVHTDDGMECITCELESPAGVRTPLEDHDDQCVWRRAKELVAKENSDEPT